MPLKNRYDEIPGGHRFFQPETGWDSFTTLPYPAWFVLRDAIIAMRKANPRFNLSTDPDRVEWEMDAQDSARLQAMPGASHFLQPASDSPIPPVFHHPQRPAAGAVGRQSKSVIGIGALVEWLGSGAEPVSPELSEKRALICSTCPKNITGNWLQRFTAAAGKLIKDTIEIKTDLELKTSVDSKLGVCDVCDCALTLKVHTPIDHVLAHTSAATMAEFPSYCWIPTERINP